MRIIRVLQNIPLPFSSLRAGVFWPPFLLLLAGMGYSFIDINQYLANASALNNWIIDSFAWLFSLSTLALLLSLIVVYFSPLGKVKIGGRRATPLLNKWQWFSIALCTTIATGILFWSTAEPLYHLHAPPSSLSMTANSQEAGHFAIATMFMHWSFTPYAIYCVPALVFALCYYNLQQPFSIGASLSPIFGNKVYGHAGQLVDAIALFSLVAGMSASLGTGILVLSGGIASLTGLSSTKGLMALVAILIVVTFVLSAVSGLQKGIARLSNLNTKIFFVFFVFVLLFGPTQAIWHYGVDGLSAYANTFLSRSTNQYPDASDNWSGAWTIFYWANWYAWAPVTALFLGKIARGYTVREFITVNLLLPASFAILWMSTFSGATLYFDQLLDGAFYHALQNQGPESVIYALLDNLPLTGLIAALFIGITFVSFVTAADSNTDVISQLCCHTASSPKTASPILPLKYLWGISVGVISWVMVSFASIDGVKMMSNLGGLPAMLIIILTNVSLFILLNRSRHRDALEPSSAS